MTLRLRLDAEELAAAIEAMYESVKDDPDTSIKFNRSIDQKFKGRTKFTFEEYVMRTMRVRENEHDEYEAVNHKHVYSKAKVTHNEDGSYSIVTGSVGTLRINNISGDDVRDLFGMADGAEIPEGAHSIDSAHFAEVLMSMDPGTVNTSPAHGKSVLVNTTISFLERTLRVRDNDNDGDYKAVNHKHTKTLAKIKVVGENEEGELLIRFETGNVGKLVITGTLSELEELGAIIPDGAIEQYLIDSLDETDVTGDTSFNITNVKGKFFDVNGSSIVFRTNAEGINGIRKSDPFTMTFNNSAEAELVAEYLVGLAKTDGVHDVTHGGLAAAINADTGLDLSGHAAFNALPFKVDEDLQFALSGHYTEQKDRGIKVTDVEELLDTLGYDDSSSAPHDEINDLFFA